MIRFARLLAASAVGTGIGIGLILCLTLNPLIRPTSGGAALPVALPAAPAPLAVATDPCALPISNNTEVQALFELHCTVHSTIFDDGEWPSVVYSFADPIASPGLCDGVNHEDKDVVLDVVYVVEADLENEAPDLFAAGAAVHMAIGTLEGVAGAIPVAGVVMHDVTDDEDYIFLVVAVLSSTDFETYTHAAAVRAGVMVQEDSDGFGPTPPAYPLATATSLPESLWAHESNLALLYGDGPATVDPACLQAADAQFAIDKWAADAILAGCLAGVAAGLSLCLAGCGAGLVLGPLGWGGFAICAGFCVAAAGDLALGCYLVHAVMILAALKKLELAYAACGLVIVRD